MINKHYVIALRRSPKHHQNSTIHKYQSGAVLFIGLIMLFLLTLIGVTGSQVTSLEEKMSGNMRDRNIAFQAAESALRDAERDITNSNDDTDRGIKGISNFIADCGFSTTDTTDDGLCYNGPSGYGTPVVGTSIWTKDKMTAAPSVAYGTFTNATPIPNLSAQPRYILEGFARNLPGYGGISYYYRITVRAQGVNPDTVVWLQSIYKPS